MPDKIISGKKIKDVDNKTLGPSNPPAAPETAGATQIRVEQGNVPLLTVQLLANIVKKLEEIKVLLEKKNG